MKHFTFTTGVVFMAMATTVSTIPYHTEFIASASGVATHAEVEATIEEILGDDTTNLPSIDEDESPELAVEPPALYINALNPGYNSGDDKEIGEFIELANSTGGDIDLSDIWLSYTKPKGEVIELYRFTAGSTMHGERIILRYNKSTDQLPGDDVYKTSLGLTGTSLALMQGENLLDYVCWNGKDEGCSPVFKSADPKVLVRNLTDLSFVSQDASIYQPEYSEDNPGLILPLLEPDEFTDESDDSSGESTASKTNTTSTAKTPHCKGLEFSEILTYYENSSEEQFVEFYNTTDYDIELDGCAINYKNKRRELSGTVPASGYFAFYPDDFTFTKNPTKSNTLELLDADDTKLDELTYQHGQKKATAFAAFGLKSDGEKTWLITYDPTPNAPNNFQEFKTCEEGKIINPTTGNCVKASSSTTTTLADCPEGKYRNPLTGRCKSIESSTTTLKECAEGYERNPETNRCRKIKTENQGTDYPLVPETYADKKTFVAFGAVGLVILAGVSYVIWQYRREISRTLRKVRNRFH